MRCCSCSHSRLKKLAHETFPFAPYSFLSAVSSFRRRADPSRRMECPEDRPPASRRAVAGPMDHGSGCRRGLRCMSFPQELLARTPPRTLPGSCLGRQPLQTLCERPARQPRPGTRRRVQLEFRDGGSRALSCAGTQRAGGRGVALRGEASSGTDDLRQPGIPSSGEHPGGRRRKYRCVMALSAQYGLCALRRARAGLLCRRGL